MAVDSKQGANTTNGSNGATANGQRTKGGRKRPSSLMAQADSLPTVEHSLEEFIAKANQTLVDVSTWGSADQQIKQEDAKQREQDAQRMKAAEGQLREGEAREHSLRRQLDGLQGKLAEAEARAAVAGTTVGSAAHDSTIQQLRSQIEQAEAQRKAFDAEKAQLARALADAKEEVAIARTSATAIDVNDTGASERVRLAEAKAIKAIAAARAAQAGLTVSPADIAAIESGLVVTNHEPPKGTSWAMILVAFVGGLGIMLAVWKLVLPKDKAPAASAAQPTATQPAAATEQPPTPTAAPAAAPTAPASVKPVVTPIEEPAAAAAPTVEAIDTPDTATKAAADKAAAAEPAGPTKAEKAAAARVEKAEAAKAASEANAEKAAAAKATKAAKASKPASPPKATKAAKPAGGVVDPFAETPAPKKTKPAKPAAKPAGGIVDPF